MTEPPPTFPELYDLDVGDFADDLPFYERLAKRADGAILELGVGTGRAAIHLARAGFDVIGIDRSEPMLERARHKACEAQSDTLSLLTGDMRTFELGRRFGLIFAGYGAFHHLLTQDDQLACLRSVERHLQPHGLFVCDLRPFDFEDWDEGESAPLFHDWTRTLQRTGETVTKLRAVRVNLHRQVKQETFLFDRAAADGIVHRLVTTIDLRFTTRYEMEGLLREVGLEVDQIYGDFACAPFDEGSEYMITVARKAARAPSC